MAKYKSQSFDDLLAIAKAMGDEGRVRVLMLLTDGELCLCQIIDILGLAPSTVSKHMSILKQAGLIEQRKEGRWHHYRLASGRGSKPMVRQALKWVINSLDDDRTVAADAKRLRGLCRRKPEEWTQCYRAGQTQEAAS